MHGIKKLTSYSVSEESTLMGKHYGDTNPLSIVTLGENMFPAWGK